MGAGRIGYRVLQRLHPFGVKLHYTDYYRLSSSKVKVVGYAIVCLSGTLGEKYRRKKQRKGEEGAGSLERKAIVTDFDLLFN